MDRTECHNLEGLTQLIMSSQSLKKVTQLLLSVSVFSFIFSYSTWYSFFLHFFKIHFSAFSSLVLSYTTDKNCIFLICNGILVVLAKTSGTSFSPSTSDHHHDERLFNKNGDHDHEDVLQSTLELIGSLPAKETADHKPPENAVVDEKEEEEKEKEKEDKDDSKLIVEYKEEEGQNEHLTAGEEEEGEGEGAGGGEGGGELQSTIEDDEEDENELGTIGFVNEEYEEEEENRLLSTEELNKKFDDFIRRMKEEIRIGAQQQLVMVQ